MRKLDEQVLSQEEPNQYEPWKQHGMTELQYFHKLHLERSVEIENLEIALKDLLYLQETDHLHAKDSWIRTKAWKDAWAKARNLIRGA